VLNKLDLIPEEERAARVAAFVKAYRWKGPVFAITAISGEGTRELIFKIQDWLDANRLSAEKLAADAAEDTTPVVVTPAPLRMRRPRTPPPDE
jgi:GTP-binding protein